MPPKQLTKKNLEAAERMGKLILGGDDDDHKWAQAVADVRGDEVDYDAIPGDMAFWNAVEQRFHDLGGRSLVERHAILSERLLREHEELIANND